MSRPLVAFNLALVQDVAVLRPLVLLARQSAVFDIEIMVAGVFAGNDQGGRWQREVALLCAEIGITPFVYGSILEAFQHLQGRRGLLVAGSESTAAAHAATHDLFRSVPTSIRTVTLQHGFECVGFLHNARHDVNPGLDLRFAAEIVVGWFAAERLPSLPASQRDKLYVAGPPMLIDPVRKSAAGASGYGGVVCENLHSVRFGSPGAKAGFLETFRAFAGRMHGLGAETSLRPHPAGRFTERWGFEPPAGVVLSEEPMYRLDTDRYAFAISAPSTVLFDFLLADVPVAVWRDPEDEIDHSNFVGLPTVGSADDWWRFAMASQLERARLLAVQRSFLMDLRIPPDVRGRYGALLALAN